MMRTCAQEAEKKSKAIDLADNKVALTDHPAPNHTAKAWSHISWSSQGYASSVQRCAEVLHSLHYSAKAGPGVRIYTEIDNEIP